MVAKDPTLSGIAMGNYELTDHHVVVGEHSGNHFKIVLRNVRADHVTSDDVTCINCQSVGEVSEAGHMTSDDVTAVGLQTTEGNCKHDHMISEAVTNTIKETTSENVATTIETASHMTSSDVTLQDASRMIANDVITSVPRAVEEIREAGFINYFGRQRFGTTITGTIPFSSLVGLAMLRNEFVSDFQVFREREMGGGGIKILTFEFAK